MATKQKVITKQYLVDALFKGAQIRWVHWDAKAFLYEYDNATQSYVNAGTIRFDTYLQLDIREIEMKLPFYNDDYTINTKCSPFEKVRRPDPWCGYDTFKLKDKVIELSKHNDFNKYFRERIWR